MSVGRDPSVEQVEQARRQIGRLAEEVAHLSDMELSPPEYYGEFLQRVLTALQAPAGAVWVRTQQGNLQLQYQINMRQTGLDTEEAREMHGELLRQTAMKAQPAIVWPHSSVGQADGNRQPPGNPSNYVILLAPIMVERQVAGLVEVWQEATRSPEAHNGFMQFLMRMAGLASGYTRNHQLRQMVGQQAVWTQLETFSRQVHGSLNPIEVAYLIANEGRRLIETDRVSVALRQGPTVTVQAISGADVVEKRSNLVQRMRALFESVLKWGERLVYSGSKDETLPPKVLKALDAYLAESNSKMLVIMPLRDDREKDSKKPARSAMMMESFEPAVSPEQLVARLEVVARHATSSLYNAAEHRRIPMRFLWMPLAKLQDGLGGKTRAILTLVGVGVVALIIAMIVVPYPLKMAADGQLLPIDRSYLFAPEEGFIKEIKTSLKSGSPVMKNQELIRLYVPGLEGRVRELERKIAEAQNIKAQKPAGGQQDPTLLLEIEQADTRAQHYARELQALRDRFGMGDANQPGEVWLRSPMAGVILSSNFRDQLMNRPVKPNEPLLRVGATDSKNPKIVHWEILLKIPQKHIGQVKAAFDYAAVNDELDVDFLLRNSPTHTFKGKLARNKVAWEANPNKDNPQEAEPIVLAWVRVSPKKLPDGTLDIPVGYELPPQFLLADAEVRARIRCGNHPMGYSLFYGVWEFIYEKIIFFF